MITIIYNYCYHCHFYCEMLSTTLLDFKNHNNIIIVNTVAVIFKVLNRFSYRFGWFIPSYVSEDKWTESQILVDHWKSLQLNEISSLFALNKDSVDLLRRFLTRKSPESDETFCNDFYDGCHGGFLMEPKCHHHNKTHGRCAILLSSYPGD